MPKTFLAIVQSFFLACLLSFTSDFLCLSSNFSFSYSLFLCLSSTFFLGCVPLSLPVFYYNFLTLLDTFLAIRQSFFLVFWGYLPSTDILCKPQFQCLLSSFLCCYAFSKWSIYLYFILSVAYFILFLLLSSTFPLSIFPSVYLVFYYYFIISIFFLSFFYFQFLAFSAYFSIFFFIVCFSFILFPILFNYLVLIILELNCCNFSLFSFSINLYYLFSFSLAVFFTKCELVSFFTFQHMLCSVFWFFT